MAQASFLKKIDDYAREFPRIVNSFYDKPEAKMVLEALYKIGIGKIIHVENLFRATDDSLNRTQLEFVLKDFSEAEIITRTGRKGETIFVSNLALAHIFGVAIAKRKDYNLSVKQFGLMGQLSLPMGYPET